MTANQQAETNDQAQLNGIIVINKPEQMTSAGVVAAVKRITKANRVGHAGTLDPMARGVLICCLNRATRLARFLLQGDKTYEATLKLGTETDTQDSTGMVVSVGDPTGLSTGTVRSVIARFVGPLKQVPPVYSALKHKGVPLYRHARRGKPVQKPARQVQIINVQILNIKLPYVHFEVTCSSGTYIRTLCADIGTTLGCGGHLHALKRLESCGFDIQNASTLEQLKECARTGTLTRQVITMADALKSMPAITADAALIGKIRHGRQLAPAELNLTGRRRRKDTQRPFYKIIDGGNNLIAVMQYYELENKMDYCCVFAN